MVGRVPRWDVPAVDGKDGRVGGSKHKVYGLTGWKFSRTVQRRICFLLLELSRTRRIDGPDDQVPFPPAHLLTCIVLVLAQLWATE